MTAPDRRAGADGPSHASSPRPVKPGPKPRRHDSWSAKFADHPEVTVHHSETLHAKPSDSWPGRA